ncbi:MAG: hypothetical protein ACLR3C_06855 [Eggerthella lenta]
MGVSDAVVKMVAAIPTLADSEVVLERLTFTAEEIERIQGDRKAAQANAAIASLLAPKKENDDGDTAQPPGLPDRGD